MPTPRKIDWRLDAYMMWRKLEMPSLLQKHVVSDMRQAEINADAIAWAAWKAALTQSQGESEPPQAGGAVARLKQLIVEFGDAMSILGYANDGSKMEKAAGELADKKFEEIESALAALPLPGALNGLPEWLEHMAKYHEGSICARAPEVVEHVQKLRQWAAALAHPAAPGQAQTEEGR